MNHLNIVHTLNKDKGGGVLSSALALNSSLRNFGIDSLITGTDNRLNSKYSDGKYIIQAYTPWLIKPYFSPFYFTNNYHLVEDSIIHCHGLYHFSSFYFSKLNRKFSKTIYSPHGMLEPFILKKSKFIKKVAYYLFEKENIKNTKYFRALTVFEADQILQYGVPHSKIEIIPNGIKINENYQSFRRNNSIIFMSRLTPKKNLLAFCSFFLKSRMPNCGWTFYIAGPEDGVSIQDIPNHESIKYLGNLDYYSKFEILKSSKFFVLPSSSEGLPMSVIEAGSVGTPSLLTKECNMPDYFNRGSIEIHLDASIVSILNNVSQLSDSEWSSLSIQSFNYVKEKFDENKVLNSYLNLFS